jgi:hypothetical protein
VPDDTLLREVKALDINERNELTALRAERLVSNRVVAWLVRQAGGRVEIPFTVLYNENGVLRRIDHPMKEYLILESK